MFQIFALLIPGFRAGTGTIRTAARTNCHQWFAADEPSISFLRIEAECQPSVYQQIDIVLEFVGDAEISHRQRHEILVGRLEMVRNAHNRLPDLELFVRVRLPVLYGVGGVKQVPVDLGKIGLPEVKSFDRVAGMRRPVGLDKARCHCSRRRTTASR
jgi:hypothetical protein